MKALRVIGIIILILVLIILVGALFIPKEYHIERTVTIEASAPKVYTEVTNFRNWTDWSPWHDSLMKYSYHGQPRTVGSKTSWEHPKAGKGSQTILSANPPDSVKIELDFGPDGKAISKWYIEPVEEGSKVSWMMDGEEEYPFGRWITVLFIKPMVGKSFETGLSQLKDHLENEKDDYSDIQIRKTTFESPKPIISIKDSTAMDKIQETIGSVFGKLGEFAGKKGINTAEPPIIYWHAFEMDNYAVYEPAFILAEPTEGNENIRAGMTYTGDAIMTRHVGSYESSAQAWYALENYVEEHNMEMNGSPWEQYVTGPMNEPDTSKWITNIYFPVKMK